MVLLGVAMVLLLKGLQVAAMFQQNTTFPRIPPSTGVVLILSAIFFI